jgi:2,3-dihydroxybenzoate-AMP ligase
MRNRNGWTEMNSLDSLDGFVPWPSEFAERYRSRGYWRGETLGELLRYWAHADSERVALVVGQRRLTYGQLNLRADRLAAGLSQMGIKPGQRVLVQLPNIPDFVHVSVALFRTGAVPVFALPSHRSSEITHLCEYSGAVAYVIPDVHQGFDYLQLAEEVRAHARDLEHVLVAGRPGPFRALDEVDADPLPLAGPRPSDPAFCLLSGGTVGLPKLIPRTHDDYAYQLRATAQGLGVDHNSVYLAALPVAHNAALGCPGLLGTLRAGGTVVLASSPSPSDIFPLIEREGVTLTTLITPLVMLWIEAAEMFGARFPSLVLQLGGAPLDPNAGRKVFRVLRSSLTHWFGMAEGLLCFTRLDDPEDVVIHTQGRPLCPDDEIRVVDDEENDVVPGQAGQLWTRGPYTLRGYFKAEEHNRLAFTPDGYLRTGDLVRINVDGNLVTEGRIKNVINRGGEKIWVEELESHLLAHPDIDKVAVVGAPDPVMGERTCAFVVPRQSPVTLPEIKSFLARRGIADYKTPDRLEIVRALPETGVGKINRVALRRMLAEPSART